MYYNYNNVEHFQYQVKYLYQSSRNQAAGEN